MRGLWREPRTEATLPACQEQLSLVKMPRRFNSSAMRSSFHPLTRQALICRRVACSRRQGIEVQVLDDLNLASGGVVHRPAERGDGFQPRAIPASRNARTSEVIAASRDGSRSGHPMLAVNRVALVPCAAL